MAGAGVVMSSLLATARPYLIGGVEDRRYAVLEGHSSVSAQVYPRHHTTDSTSPEPDEIQGLAAVVDLYHQCRYVDPWSQGHTADGAEHTGLRAVHQVDDQGPAQPPGVLLQVLGFELGLSSSQACAHAREQPGPASALPVLMGHSWFPSASGSR